MKVQITALALLLLFVAPLAASAGTQDGSLIVLHATAANTPPRCSTDPVGTPLTPCSAYTVDAPLMTSMDVFLVVAHAQPAPGIAGLSCGIDYDAAAASGVDVSTWTLCADLEFPNAGTNGDWPAAGGGNRITWVHTTNCQNTVIDAEGVHAVAGFFRVYAYSDDVMQVTPNMNLMSGPEIAVADCSAAESHLPETSVGSVGFGSMTGFNPCVGDVPVEPTSWGRIKVQYD